MDRKEAIRRIKVMEEEHETKGVSKETAEQLAQALLDITDDSPFAAADLQRMTNELTRVIVHELAKRLRETAYDYYICKFRYRYLSKHLFRWYHLMRARKALVKYRNAFHALESFKREFGYEEAE